VTNISPQRYSVQNKISNRAQKSKELLDKILPSKTFLPSTHTYQRERDESPTIYSKNTETEVSLRSCNPDEEERPRKAHARHILVEDSDQVNIEQQTEEGKVNPSSPFRVQEEKRIMEYQNIIGELQERIRTLETERTLKTEETFIGDNNKTEVLNEKISYHSTTSQERPIELEQQVADLKDQLVNFQDDNQNLKNRLNEQEVSQNSLIRQLRDMISQLEQENRNFVETTQNKDQQIQQLEEKLQENETQAQDLQKTLEKLSTQVKSLQSEKDTNSEQTNKLTNSLNELKRANSLADQSNEELVSKYNQLEQDYSELNEQSKILENLLAQEKQQFTDLKSQNEQTIQNFESQLHETNQEKDSLVSQISSVLQQADINTVTDENLKQVLTQMTQYSNELSQFKAQEGLIKAKIQELSQSNQDLLHQIETQQEKLKEAEEQTQNFQGSQNSQIKTLQDKISQLEKENSTLSRALQNNVDENAKNLMGQNKTLQEKNELYQLQTQSLENQNTALLGQLTALKNSLQLIQEEKDTHHSELKNLQTEKAQLQENIEKTENLLKKANDELKELKDSISAAAGENQKLQHQFDENQLLLKNLKTEKEQEGIQHAKFQEELQSLQKKSQEDQAQIKSLQDENIQLQNALQSSAGLKQALDELNKKVLVLNQEKDQANQKVTTLQEDVASKDKEIEGLKYDLTQIKGFLFQRQSELSVLEHTENDDQRSENRLTLQSDNSFSQDISTSFRELSEWETGGVLRSKSFKNKTKPQKTEGDETSKSTEYIKANPKLKHQSFSMKIKKPKDEDPIRSSYEKIIRELNEKIANNEKNYKKEISLRVLEAKKQHIEKEEQLQAEIDNLQQEKNNLLKKIEDIEWDKAYEYNDKTKKDSKPGSIKMEDTLSAHANGDSEAKKKKKKKKKTKTNDPDEN